MPTVAATDAEHGTVTRGTRGLRWELDDAIEDSDLPGSARHVLHTLLRRADPGTGQIPDQFRPSLEGLVNRTGMKEKTVSGALDLAEKRGWLIRERTKGGRGCRTRYTIVNPADANPGQSAGVPADVNPPEIGGVPAVNPPEMGGVPAVNPPEMGGQLDLRSEPSLSPRARALDEALAERLPSSTDEERENLIRWIEEQNPRNHSAYLRGIPQADLTAKLEEIRGGLRERPGSGPGPHSTSCREGTHQCSHDWCTCTCHR